ncbi:uncharacterized protein LOC123894029 [Trifolium pratense]|uniref:Uncharacterized protein n=1 Tax=Trifolium pratense TaxID=57577 RepID=A0ACB0I6L6_TRIPR|nr:uncharacterized protein LOC123894029 [Trifolium pratense]CAJ2627723.1 unnamed protein product [Trifolium pratense]
MKPLQMQRIQLLLAGYDSQVGENTGSRGSAFKRAHESDASDPNSIGSSALPMGRDATKKKGKKKGNELERLDKIAMRQEDANQLLKQSIEAKKMMFMKLNSKEHLDDRSKELLEKLGRDLFGN